MATTTESTVRPFINEPISDYRRPENAAAMRAAIELVRKQLGREYPLVIGGKHVRTVEKIVSVNPAKPSEVVGIHQKAGREEVEPAMQAALAAFAKWQYASVEERTGVLLRTAEILRRRKFEFNAWLVLEVGKNYDEAEADTCEAIDFLELYARQALLLDQAEPVVQLPGERDFLRYIALGVGAVISPWNFPNAIALGMTGASLVCGNTVILKPSSDSPTIAAKFFEALEEAGMPPGVVNFCPGSGATFGNGIVEHPKTRYIAFTGSRDVGLEIHYI
jgi:1-pyrroline-5-carboxylate dehydrogenase